MKKYKSSYVDKYDIIGYALSGTQMPTWAIDQAYESWEQDHDPYDYDTVAVAGDEVIAIAGSIINPKQGSVLKISPLIIRDLVVDCAGREIEQEVSPVNYDLLEDIFDNYSPRGLGEQSVELFSDSDIDSMIEDLIADYLEEIL
jgi:hypothetical protein